MPEPTTFVTCVVCNRIVRDQDVNNRGRCVDCAGQPIAQQQSPDDSAAPKKADTEKRDDNA